MYQNEHNPAHFHAYYGEYKAIFNINTSEKMEGKFPKKATKIIREWAVEHKKELLDNWRTMRENGYYKKIKGADE